MVDATLIRHHPGQYGTVLATHSPAERWLIKETLGGLRFARNWISREAGLDDIIQTGADTRIARWRWDLAPEPVLDWLPPRAQAWERTRWQAYQACLADDTIGETFSRAVTFLTLAGAEAASSRDT